jgi:hypothetical protein
MRTGMLIAALLCATPALAQETKDPPPPGDTQLSKEDEELVKELALLERLELVKNLELFEPEKDDEEPKPPPQGQP